MAHVHVRVHFRENFAHFRQTEIRENIESYFFLKGVFSKASGNYILASIFPFFGIQASYKVYLRGHSITTLKR